MIPSGEPGVAAQLNIRGFSPRKNARLEALGSLCFVGVVPYIKGRQKKKNDSPVLPFVCARALFRPQGVCGIGLGQSQSMPTNRQ